MELFRGQYYFGQSTQRCPDNFVSEELTSDIFIQKHKDLPCAKVVESGSYLVIIGFCFDYARPESSLHQIATRLHKETLDTFIKATGSLSGRWVIIKGDGTRQRAIHDAGGTFPICYLSHAKGLSFASSSKLIEWMHPGRPLNQEITDSFREKQSIPGQHAGFSFPLKATSFSDVFALLPNHFLDIERHRSQRYFPNQGEFGTKTAKQMAPEIAKMLTQIISAAAHRHNLRFAATGGFDSRLLQGAISNAGDVAAKTDFFTFQYPNDQSGSHIDIINARQAAEIIGAQHQVICAKSEGAVEDVTSVCRASEEFFATGFEGWVEAGRDTIQPNQLVIMGWASEIARGFYRWAGSDQATTQDLMRCDGFENMREFEPLFDAWRQDAAEAQAASNIQIMDLFYWENRVARWCSSGLNVLNTGADWVTLFSCRDLLEAMLSVREKDRVGRRQVLYRTVAHALEPQLDRIEPNPMSPKEIFSYLIKSDLKNFVMSFAIRIGVDKFLSRRG